MSIRLNKAISELNIGLQTAVEFLTKKYGLAEDSLGLTTKIDDAQYEALVTAFKQDKEVKSQVDKLFPKKPKEKKPQEPKETRAESLLEPASQQKFNPLGKIDLSTVGKKTAPKTSAAPEPQQNTSQTKGEDAAVTSAPVKPADTPPAPKAEPKPKAPKAEPKPSVEITVVEDEPLEEQIQEEKPVETDMDNDMEAMEEKEEPPQPPTEEEEERFRIVRDLPQFPGGLTEFTKWLTRNLKYPKSLENRKIEGSVIAEFMVNTDGSITDVKIVQTLHPDCDNEVLRVLRMMPRWTPGIENDKPCRTVVRVPVVFNS